MVKVIPAILTADPVEARELLERAEGKVDRVQIDIVDGVFANNKTVDPVVFEGLETNLNLDFHLMVKEPVNWIERVARAGADRIIAQIEMMANQVEFVEKVQALGLYVGLAIDVDTEVSELDPLILNNLDAVLVMSVPAGFGGQEFDQRVLGKIEKLDEIRARDKTPFKICGDGGITLDKIDDVRIKGVDEVVIGPRIFEGDIEANIQKFLKAAYKQ